MSFSTHFQTKALRGGPQNLQGNGVGREGGVKVLSISKPQSPEQRTPYTQVTTASHSGTGASLCDGWKEAHTFFLPLSIFKSYLLQEPLYSYEASTRLSPFSGFLNLYLSFMVYGPSANLVAPWTYSPPTDCSIQLKETVHSELGLLYSSPCNPSELLEIMSKPQPCKTKLNQQRKADQAVSLALERMTFKVLYSSPRKLPSWKKRGTCPCPGIAPIGHHFAETLSPKVLVHGSEGPISPARPAVCKNGKRDSHSELTQ